MGVCKQSRWRHSVTVPHTRWRICVTRVTLWQQQDGGYALLWKRYDNNKMAAICYYGNVMATRWRLCVSMETLSQHWDNVSFCCWRCVYWACYRCILHLQQYSHRQNLLLSFLWGKQIVKTQSKQRMPLIAIYCYSVLFATNGSKTGNVCIMEHFGTFL